ncbi:MAG: hypothetical protein ACRC33_04940 [Gemmataceae bacterium]
MTEDNRGAADGVLRKMVATYPAPNHLRGNREGYEAALDVYRRALSRFSPEAIEKGYQKACEGNDLWCWVKVGQLVAAVESFEPRRRPDDGWVARATEMADACVKRHMKSAQAARAEAGGYGPELRTYVREAAWVQAQYALGRGGIAYRSAVLFAHCPGDRDEQEAFFGRCREQAATGQIKVTVPPRLVKAWRESHAGEGRGR